MKHLHAFFYRDNKGGEWIFGEESHSHENGDDVHGHNDVHGSRHKLAIRKGRNVEKNCNKEAKSF